MIRRGYRDLLRKGYGMNIDFKLLQTKLAENKVYDAWQFVEGLVETLRYMNLSKELACKTFDHRKQTLEERQNERFNAAITNPGTRVPITLEALNPTQSLSGIEIGDTVIMQKSVLEFFHYARLSVEVVTQILNAALFGDDSVSISDRYFPSKVSKKIAGVQQFVNISTIISNTLNNPEIAYLMRFDNYTKHVKTASFAIKNSLFFGNASEFKIMPFVFDGVMNPEEDAVDKLNAVSKAVDDYIEAVLAELIIQIQYCQGTTQRFHTVRYKSQLKESEGKSYLDYIVYFIEVENDIHDLPTQISLLPLVIMPDGNVQYTRIPVKKIFVTLKGQDEKGICGYAEEELSQDSTEMYRKYTIKQGTQVDFIEYFANFKKDYADTKFPMKAMDGTMIIYQE